MHLISENQTYIYIFKWEPSESFKNCIKSTKVLLINPFPSSRKQALIDNEDANIKILVVLRST